MTRAVHEGEEHSELIDQRDATLRVCRVLTDEYNSRLAELQRRRSGCQRFADELRTRAQSMNTQRDVMLCSLTDKLVAAVALSLMLATLLSAILLSFASSVVPQSFLLVMSSRVRVCSLSLRYVVAALA
jgi:hypothetical protein